MKTNHEQAVEEIEAFESATYDSFVHGELVKEIMDELSLDVDE